MADYSKESWEALLAFGAAYKDVYNSGGDMSYEDWMNILMHIPQKLGVQIHASGFIELLKTLKDGYTRNLTRACNYLLEHRELIPY